MYRALLAVSLNNISKYPIDFPFGIEAVLHSAEILVPPIRRDEDKISGVIENIFGHFWVGKSLKE